MRGSNLVTRGNCISSCCVSETVVAMLQGPAGLLCMIRYRNVGWFVSIVQQFQGYPLYDCVGIFWYWDAGHLPTLRSLFCKGCGSHGLQHDDQSASENLCQYDAVGKTVTTVTFRNNEYPCPSWIRNEITYNISIQVQLSQQQSEICHSVKKATTITCCVNSYWYEHWHD